MSGRAYARDAQGFLGGGADLESIVPHTFRIASPKRSLSARELGIRRCVCAFVRLERRLFPHLDTGTSL